MEKLLENITKIKGVESVWIDRFSSAHKTVVLCARSISRACDAKILKTYANHTQPQNWNIEIEIERT